MCDMMDELRAALEQIEARPEISAIVFAGSERAFSSGVEIAEHTADKIRNTLTAFHSVIRSVVASRKLTIACVRRHCLGGGAELALMCDVAFASPDSVWGFPKSSWRATRRLPAWRCPPLWDRSLRRRWY